MLKEDIHVKAPKVVGIELNRVGVSGVPFPLTVKGRGRSGQQVKAMLDMFGSLRHDVKGISMSRFCEALSVYSHVGRLLYGGSFRALLSDLLARLNKGESVPISNDVFVKARFDYRVTRYAPVSHRKSFMYYECAFIGLYRNKIHNFITEVRVPVASLCPCSKNLCLEDKEKDIGQGAHNQRGIVTIQIATEPCYPGAKIEDVIDCAEQASSSRLYTILKRPDEEYVTRAAYKNPKFVEDIARESVSSLKKLKKVCWVRVKVENFESIHMHSAVAYCEYSREKGKWNKTNIGFY